MRKTPLAKGQNLRCFDDVHCAPLTGAGYDTTGHPWQDLELCNALSVVDLKDLLF
jgi:hypothetical protein